VLVGIHKDQYGKFCPFLQKYEKILDYNNIEHIRLDASELDFWEKVRQLDLFIFRWKHIDDHHQLAKTIIPIIEKNMHIKCFPNMDTCWHYDDKIRQYYLLKHYGFPIIDSWVFWDKDKALQWIKTADLPIVFKLKGGAGSSNVILVKSKKQAIYLINRMFGKGIISGAVPDKSSIKYKSVKKYIRYRGSKIKILRQLRGMELDPHWQRNKNYVLFQKYLPNNEYDTRVTVIGNSALAFRRFNRDNDFRSSGSGKINYELKKIDIQFIKLAFEISNKMRFQSMAYDFLYDENKKPLFCEISYTYQDLAVYNCPGYWDSNLNWHEGHYWPQYFQLMDLLNMPEFKQP